CFTLRVNTAGCTFGKCCNVDLKKIEFDINGKCLVKSASIKATVNGQFTTTGPNIYVYKFDSDLKYVLRLTNLNMGLNYNNAKICLSLTAGTNDTGCDTLEELCASPSSSSPPGTCQASIFNNNNSTGSCCPTTIVFMPRPPPPHRLLV
ncbi:hypothetical protein VaNZ11_010616, partial [Volvox africanus]